MALFQNESVNEAVLERTTVVKSVFEWAGPCARAGATTRLSHRYHESRSQSINAHGALLEFAESPAHLAQFEASSSLCAFAPCAYDEALDFAVILTPDDSEQSVLAPVTSP